MRRKYSLVIINKFYKRIFVEKTGMEKIREMLKEAIKGLNDKKFKYPKMKTQDVIDMLERLDLRIEEHCNMQQCCMSQRLSKEIFSITSGAWDDHVISEDLYNRMKDALQLTEIIPKTIDETYETISVYVNEWFDSSYDEKMKDIDDLKKDLIEKYVGGKNNI